MIGCFIQLTDRILSRLDAVNHTKSIDEFIVLATIKQDNTVSGSNLVGGKLEWGGWI